MTLSTASGLLLVISSSIAHDVYYLIPKLAKLNLPSCQDVAVAEYHQNANYFDPIAYNPRQCATRFDEAGFMLGNQNGRMVASTSTNAAPEACKCH